MRTPATTVLSAAIGGAAAERIERSIRVPTLRQLLQLAPALDDSEHDPWATYDRYPVRRINYAGIAGVKQGDKT